MWYFSVHVCRCTGSLTYLNSNLSVYVELLECNKHYIQHICSNVIYSVSSKSRFFFKQIITLTINVTMLTNNICIRNWKILVVLGVSETPGLLKFVKVFVLCWNEWMSVYRYNEDLELEDAIHTAILTLKVSKIFKKEVSYVFIDMIHWTVFFLNRRALKGKWQKTTLKLAFAMKLVLGGSLQLRLRTTWLQ